MKILFVHQNFPGQYLHLARHLGAMPVNQVVFITQRKDAALPGVRNIVYQPQRPITKVVHHYLRETEAGVLNAQMVARAAVTLKESGFVLDVMLGCLLIASRTAPVEEVIRDGENWFLVDFFSPAEMAERVAGFADCATAARGWTPSGLRRIRHQNSGGNSGTCRNPVRTDPLVPPHCKHHKTGGQPRRDADRERLRRAGYAARTHRGWHGLFDLFQPDAVVLDYVPTALLAARTRGIPTVLTGNGFELPPRQSPLPSFRAWDDIPNERLLLAEDIALRNINAVLAECRAQPMMQFADIFGGEHKILTTFSELDHYGMRSGQIYTGPVYELPNAHPAGWPAGTANLRILHICGRGCPMLNPGCLSWAQAGPM